MRKQYRPRWTLDLFQPSIVLFFTATLICTGAALANAADNIQIRIECDRPAVPLSPHLYGLFFEDINFAADGGLYAELVRNRSPAPWGSEHGIPQWKLRKSP